jgi:hypothetical protein
MGVDRWMNMGNVSPRITWWFGSNKPQNCLNLCKHVLQDLWFVSKCSFGGRGCNYKFTNLFFGVWCVIEFKHHSMHLHLTISKVVQWSINKGITSFFSMIMHIWLKIWGDYMTMEFTFVPNLLVHLRIKVFTFGGDSLHYYLVERDLNLRFNIKLN